MATSTKSNSNSSSAVGKGSNKPAADVIVEIKTSANTTKKKATTTKKKSSSSKNRVIEGVKKGLIEVGASLLVALVATAGQKIKDDWEKKKDIKEELKDCELVVKGFELNSSIMDKVKLEMIKKRVNHIFVYQNLCEERLMIYWKESEFWRRKIMSKEGKLQTATPSANNSKSEQITRKKLGEVG